MVDARLKLLLAVTGIVSVFSASTLQQFVLPVIVAVSLLGVTGSLGTYLRLLYALRWFVLFVLLLHLLFSPGRTLFGTFFLSLDGGLLGLQVSIQVALAMGFSLLLTRLTDQNELTAAFALLLRPLRLFGVKTDHIAEQMLLTLHVTPIVQDEGAKALTELRANKSKVAESGLIKVATEIRYIIETMLNRMLDRIEAMAVTSASSDSSLPEMKSLPGFNFSWLNAVAVAIFVGLILNLVSA